MFTGIEEVTPLKPAVDHIKNPTELCVARLEECRRSTKASLDRVDGSLFAPPSPDSVLDPRD